jgi:lantibiotic modifying enzyme
MAREIAYSIAANFPASGDMDNIESAAGAIPGLLALSALLDDSSLVDAAARIADALIVRCSCLMSHGGHPSEGDAFTPRYVSGASGIAAALIELYAVTGRLPYLQFAEEVFERESAWDCESGLGWRRGIAGRALARLRWCQVHRSERAVTAAQHALDCLRTTVASALHGDAVHDRTLIDGLPGAVEVLLFAQEVFPGDSQSQDISDRALASGLAKDPPSAWDWSTISADPGLMCGMSGWGYIYLRRACSTVPSALLLGRLREGSHGTDR